MKTIKLTHPHSLNSTELPPLAMALGYFDGVHRGHQEVITAARKLAEEKGLKSAVMTFDPHPSVVLRKNTQHVEAITAVSDKIELIEDLQIDYLFIVNFSEAFAALLPQEFIDQYIINLNVKHVVAGFDYSYGRLGKGTMETMPFHSRSAFDQTVISKQTDRDRKISSTLIREVLRNGDVEYACTLLNRPHRVKGTVIHGDKRGRTIGFPTANIELDNAYIIPPTGVYAVQFELDGERYNGVCNIGYKPTFYDDKKLKPSIEVHIFEFNKSIYGKNVAIFWYKRIRSEQKFGSIDELITQIGKDKASAEQFFQKLQD
ncbi:bifunctional riboflavin kinase/FAD synthetase [Metabacillus indicus]|uniref:bifunctional riboflavin kinase/FAD synthetase n=1 Tax=Metabacillus indicus TaxID=246786 RepID=UPI000493AA6B|nr:bifunctional riboflavin kinase/FAD synthetase [Metabacillus indicus]KEZ50132.1 riboflavin biosynthesis protein RibF [Metabacillus indicus LMG 22858]